MKVRPVGVELFHADGQTGGTDGQTDKTDMAKLIVLFAILRTRLKCISEINMHS